MTIPLITKCLLDAVEVLSNGSRTFALRCVEGLEADREYCQKLVERSLMLVTALNPHIGYDQAAKVAKKAFSEDKTLREVILELGLMEEVEVDKALDPKSMIRA